MAKKKPQPAPGPAGNTISNCSFVIEAPPHETEANMAQRAEAAKALASAAEANADAIKAVAEILRGPAGVTVSDSPMVKFGS